ncbi:hypothetical protein HAX54_041522 [Datura stramonium]|uniref:Uncharacterized protein n=1 Tax=Datura stramonium TaxID=4076 RepID=A0ABS8RHI8_DATST|nr:hypothetical protein [Datura stramonium]
MRHFMAALSTSFSLHLLSQGPSGSWSLGRRWFYYYVRSCRVLGIEILAYSREASGVTSGSLVIGVLKLEGTGVDEKVSELGGVKGNVPGTDKGSP